MQKEWWKDYRLSKLPFHMRIDEAIYIANKEAGLSICEDCHGRGNELYSMYRKCPRCDGTGNLEKIKADFHPKLEE